MNCCDYDCNQGRDCPARAKRCHDLPAPTAPMAEDTTPSGGTVATVLTVVAVVWLVAVVIAPFLAGWWHA